MESKDEKAELLSAAVRELKDWVRAGHLKLAPGNRILWTPEEWAAMTPQERENCKRAEEATLPESDGAE